MPEATGEPPFHPIIYVRGYAGTEDEVENTVADPYMGFNLGATKVRQHWTGKVVKYFFESPLVRLMKDFHYQDVYTAGAEMAPGVEVPSRPIVIYRYHERASKELGFGKREQIEAYAKGLSELILEVRNRLCGDDAATRAAFKICLIAHSMGGLICRCFLQNPEVGADEARKCVDKVFTYATPHNGIDVDVVGNVPEIISLNESDVFNRDRMKGYLALPATAPDAKSLNGKFDPDRLFCLVGTNHRDYDAAYGLSRRLVGPSSDGLVRIANAAVWGPARDESGAEIKVQSPRAFVHRSHSGHYGIVNSEEGYQNLVRFLFGDVRVDGVLEIEEITLPPKVQEFKDAGKEIRASYHFEVIVRVRGATWDLHRRTVGEESAIFRTFDEVLRPTRAGRAADDPRHPCLFSAFLSARARINARRASLGFSVDLGVLVPEYEVDKKLWLDGHYNGGYLFRDGLNLEAIPPEAEGKDWRLRYGLDSISPNRATREAESARENGRLVFRIPIEQKSRPGIKATLLLRTRKWA